MPAGSDNLFRYLVIAALIAGCGKKKDETPSRSAGDSETPAALAQLDLGARAQAIAGAWVFEHDSPKLAVEIKGDDVTTWDGKKEVHAKLKLDTPCFAGFMVSKGGGEEGTFYTVVLSGGKARLGLGAGGQRVGKGAVVCAGLGTYALDDAGTCTLWEHFGAWRSKPAKCGFQKDGGKDVFVVDDATTQDKRTLAVDGDAIWDEQLRDHGATHVADFAAARAVVDADVKAHDPGAIAAAAGGKVGDTSTVAGLAATFAADPAKTTGQKVTLTGMYVNSQTVSSNGGPPQHA